MSIQESVVGPIMMGMFFVNVSLSHTYILKMNKCFVYSVWCVYILMPYVYAWIYMHIHVCIYVCM